MIDEESLKSIERLHQLRKESLITDEEFERSKQRILFGPSQVRHAAKAIALPHEDDHISWVMLALKRYADFSGRSSRKEFWMFQLIYIALFVVTSVIVEGDTDRLGDIGFAGKMAIASAIIALLVLFVPLLAVEIRRFHDQDKSGWFAMLNLIPYLGPIIVMGFMLVEGTAGDNKYGPDPKHA